MSEWFKRVLVHAIIISIVIVLAIIFPFFQPISGLFFSLIAIFLIVYGFSDPKYMFRRLISSLVALLIIPNVFSQTIDSIKSSISSTSGADTLQLIILDLLSFAYDEDNLGIVISAIFILSVLESKNILLEIVQNLKVFGGNVVSPLLGKISLKDRDLEYYCKANVHNSSPNALYVNSSTVKISFFRVANVSIYEDENEKPLKLASHSDPIEISAGSLKVIAVYGSLQRRCYLFSPLRWFKKKLGIGYSGSIRFNGSGTISTIEAPLTFHEKN
ncbi:MAG: hypothetical protein AAF423_09070 [Pseudomonadota bacterium]